MTNETIIKAFTDGKKTKGNNLFSEYDNNENLVLYSYGHHFPLSIKLNDGFVINKSKYSKTTTRQQNILKSYIYGTIKEMNTGQIIKLQYINDIKKVVDIIEQEL